MNKVEEEIKTLLDRSMSADAKIVENWFLGDRGITKEK